MNDKEYKTADYTRRAIANYRAKKDTITITLDKGTKDNIINKCGNVSLSKYIQKLIDKDLKEKEDIKPVESFPFDNIPFTRPTE